MGSRKSVAVIAAGALAATSLVALAMQGCGSSSGSGFPDTNADDSGLAEGGFGFGGDGGDGGCVGLACQKVACQNGASTTITGTAYAPNGKLALYNVIAFIPNVALDPFVDQVSCDQCGKVSGNPVVSATSDPTGHFVLSDVPVGDNIPLVLQVGKWRRKITIPHVEQCTENRLTDPDLTRLPKNHTEGDMPHIAVTTGYCDNIACVLPKMGIDPSEFGVAADIASKRVIFYEGALDNGHAGFFGATPAQDLWGNLATLSKFDAAIFSCECDEHLESKPNPDRATVAQYLDSGGRTFATDFGYTWVHGAVGSSITPPPAPISSIMQGFRGGAPWVNPVPPSYSIETSFPKGAALDQWLQAVKGSTIPGQIKLSTVFRNFDRADPALSQRWVYGTAEDKVFSYTTPFSSPPESRCGKSVFLDVHVGDGIGEDVANDSSSPFPQSCGTAELTPQEKMMVFFLMDLSSCIQDDKQVVTPPK